MSKHNAFTRSADAIRDLDPALKTSLTQDERQRADAMFAHIVGTSDELTWPAHNRPRRRRARVLIPVGLIAVTAVALPPVITGESAFASWTATPTPLSPADEADAAATCRVALSMGDDPRQVVVLGERRGGWTYVLLEGPGGKGSCLMSDDLVGQREKDVLNRKQGDFFGGYENHTTHQTPPHDGIIETESMGSAVPPRSHRPRRTKCPGRTMCQCRRVGGCEEAPRSPCSLSR